MGYFSNGTEGDMYEAQYCDKCQHQDGPKAPKRIWIDSDGALWVNDQKPTDRESVEYLRADAVNPKRKPLPRKLREEARYLISVLGDDGKSIVRELLRRAGGG